MQEAKATGVFGATCCQKGRRALDGRPGPEELSPSGTLLRLCGPGDFGEEQRRGPAGAGRTPRDLAEPRGIKTGARCQRPFSPRTGAGKGATTLVPLRDEGGWKRSLPGRLTWTAKRRTPSASWAVCAFSCLAPRTFEDQRKRWTVVSHQRCRGPSVNSLH
ncbi:hypothetical protein AAFF_G00304190 [Aldrovandia affinis]|uniref:Uncharacterized protein n=1 Tax=Aldrovandia affinis TaxID=143900 RepID=A0AAD7SQ08_9TELE|nr:hypothetical protein AAFF_G00304190 [Aldrovandia affinis]